jgi:hypothetical protein
MLNPRSTEENSMKKFGYMIAALGAIIIAAPSIASAETVVIKRGGYHHGYGARAEMHRDHGWHSGWRHRHANKVVIIKKRHHAY